MKSLKQSAESVAREDSASGENPLYQQQRRDPYGYCPICGAPGVTRERRPNGNDKCASGHEYPSALAILAEPPQPLVLPRPDSPWIPQSVCLSVEGHIALHNSHPHRHLKISEPQVDGDLIVSGLEKFADGERVSVSLTVSKIKPSDWIS